MKKLLVGLLLVVLGLLVVACGTSGSTSEPTTSPLDTAAPTAASPVAASPSATPELVAEEVATVGDTLSLSSTTGTVVAVKLVATKRLARAVSYGVEMHPALFGVRLVLKNVGDGVYEDAADVCSTLADGTGRSRGALIPPIMTASGSNMTGCLTTVKLKPGERASGWVYFKAGKKMKPALYQYTPDYATASDVGEWELKQ